MRVAFIGTGLMGRPMAARLLGVGHTVTVYNRTRTKAEPLAPLGAHVADSPAMALEAAETVVLMLADGTAIRDTLFADAARARLAAHTVIQMGTIAPEESRSFADMVCTASGAYLEAPVLGSIAEAEAGTLTVMVGAAPELFDHWAPLLRCFGPEPLRVGPVGHAAALKLALNQLIGSQMAAFALSLGLVQRAGVDPDLFMRVLRGSTLFAPTFGRKLPRLLDRHYADPNFPIKHLLKDICLALGEARHHGLAASALEGVEHLLRSALAQGLADADYSALYEIVNPPQQAGG